MDVYDGREKIGEQMKEKATIGDIRGVYGVGNIPQYFLGILALRALLWGGNPNNVVILPKGTSKNQEDVERIKNMLIYVLGLKEKNVIMGDFRELTSSNKREPYMRTDYYFDPEYIENNKKIIELVRYFGDKVNLAYFIKNIDESLLPSNTKTYIDKDNFDEIKEEIKHRFNSKSSFIIKAGEGASGENMLLVFFEGDNIYVSHHKTNGKKQINNYEELLNELDIAIPENQMEKEINGEKKTQNFLIQDLVDLDKYDEKSINFYIPLGDKNYYLTSYGRNVAKGGVHIGNIEEKVPENILKKFKPILDNLIKEGYYGPIGFDFFTDGKNVKIIEANTRYTAPITPSMLVYKLQEQNKIGKNFTWKLIQKFETNIDLTILDDLKKYNLVEKIIKENEIKDACFLVYSPVFGEKYQSVIFIGPNQESIDELEKIIRLKIDNLKNKR